MPPETNVEEKFAFTDRRNRRRLLKNRIYDIAHRSIVYFLAGTTAAIGLAVLADMAYFTMYRYPALRREQRIHEKYLLNTDEEDKKE